MYNMYRSMIGTCNIVFSVAMVLLTIRFWNETNIFLRLLMIFACCIFTIIQPIAVYFKSKKQEESLPKNMTIKFDDSGVHVRSDKAKSDIQWKNIKSVVRKLNMIIVFSTTTHGFILTNNMIGLEVDSFYDFLISKKVKK